ncbi:MAG: glycoside hydrolase [Acidimicrobiia bacterium]|nr:glycoside hydrolase [Acidimicrobiia bacterium]
MPLIVLTFVLVTTLLTSCRGGYAPGADPSGTLPSGAVANGQTVDCRGDGSCPELVVEGDPPATLPSGAPAPLRGLSDATIRRDPVTGVVWMAYSWPSVHVDGGRRSTRVETHLARSDDDGRTWHSAGPLWTAAPATDPVTGSTGTIDHEVPNLLPVTDSTAGTTRWVAARLDLFVPDGGTLRRRPPSSFRIAVLAAPDPMALAAAEPAVLGSAATDAGWGVDVDLTDLDDALARCTLWNEPALHHEGGTLFLAVRCLPLGRDGTPDVAAGSLEVFATEPDGEPGTWRWRYAGRLAGAEEAAELGGDGLTQLELATSRDGTLLAIVTPDRWHRAEQEFVHLGLRVVEVTSLARPALARDADGRLVVRAAVTASDLEPLGPGAGTYEPSAAVGIVLMRRDIGRGQLVASLHDTGLHP